MTLEQIEKTQVEIYRKLGEEGRLRIAFELYELARNTLRQVFIDENPKISETELNKKVAGRMSGK